jgi:TM2 domain-containing membrane protein YozV
MAVKDIFENVNNWLKFAEAKNGAIIALNSAFIFGLLRLLQSSNTENLYKEMYIKMIIFLLLVSLIMALLSFIPKLKYPYIKFDKISKKDNLLYFIDIAKYTDNEYYEKITTITEKSSNEKLDKYYIQQIIINSQITYIKYKQFEIAVWFTLSAILTPLGAIILFTYKKYK